MIHLEDPMRFALAFTVVALAVPVAERYSGLVPVSVPADGTYRVSAGSPVWIDVVEGTRPVPSAKFEGHSPAAARRQAPRSC